MFRGWGFLLGEIWALIALAALLGLFVGWLIWARRGRTTSAASQDEMGRLRAELTACQAKDRNAAARIDALEAELAAARHQAAPAAEPAAQPETAPAAVLAAPRAEAIAETPDEPASEPAQAVGTRPARLDAPRDGAADDLKRIKGIGPKTAKRAILDLKDKMLKDSGEELALASPQDNTIRDEALSALVALQFNRIQAQKALNKALKENPGIAGVEQLIKLALKELS